MAQGDEQTTVISALWPDECMDLISTSGVGRFVFSSERGPVALPVHYVVVDGDVYFAARRGGSIEADLPDAPVSFEVDDLDPGAPERSEEWSVLLTGRARAVDDPELLRRLEEIRPSEGQQPPVWVRFVPIERSGRLSVARAVSTRIVT
ncbi:pyridoxamine 5'-phosphate oxidase family protein [Acidiferrimicrobium sp. IK]|uniref:pyridoxamine 5'-phosphate oxidase family protein n=1 Tax=Acidiferrimicrobium sp. IK TaxID=2871700 RepID=UPI0021CB6740|nr:pyridoxamine 5'-phosphate oxidase family protein [Acidiferrimicrobium sp. IK]MCU4182862.1 pyridoxamine 5'-phosphate oxidase family protein [Acidiferrimicrobium sp. IK]